MVRMPGWLLLLLLMLVPPLSVMAQPERVGFGVQVYPAGFILSSHAVSPVSPSDALLAFVGYNRTNRGDGGEHEEESGGGAGAGVAWRHFQGPGHTGLFYGARLDFWRLGITWTDDGGQRRGRTDVSVLQPTGQLGYTLSFAEGRWVLVAEAALGVTLNVEIQGEAVGQGLIVLGGVGFGYRF